jgi:hypothetical protein
MFNDNGQSSISDHPALCLVLCLHACCPAIHLCHLCRRGSLVPRRALAPPLLSSSFLVLALRALHQAPLVSFQSVPSASRDQWGTLGARHLCTVDLQDRSHISRMDISSPSCCASASSEVRADRSRDRSVDMRVASLRGRCASTDSHLHWNMSESARSTSTRAFVVGCIRVRTRKSRLSCTSRAASACTQDWEIYCQNELFLSWKNGRVAHLLYEDET